MEKALAFSADLESVALMPKALTQLVERFNSASARLQERYEELQQETARLHAQLQQKDEEIRQTARLAMLGETAAAIAHEVRNPLGAIKLFLSLLRRDLSSDQGALMLVDEIEKSIGSLDNVVANILRFSRQKPLDMAPININLLIREQATRFISEQVRADQFRFELCEDGLILGNEESIRQLFFNLFMNALQATRQRGVITISSSRAADSFEIIVSDDGPGIPERLLERIFEPFVTSRNEGTGLGLAIVRQIVTQHGGTVAVRNASGAVFKISFPIESQQVCGEGGCL